MPDISPPDGLSVEVLFSLFGQPSECRHWFIPRPHFGEPTLESAATAVAQYWAEDMMPLLSDQLTFVGVIVKAPTLSPPQQLRIDFPTPFQGGIATPALCANVAVRVGLQVVNPPGDWRSCFFLPGVPSNQVAGNTLANDWVASVNDVASNLIDRAETNNWRWVVATRFVDRVQLEVAIPYRVDFVQLLTPWVSQRRKRLFNQVFTP